MAQDPFSGVVGPVPVGALPVNKAFILEPSEAPDPGPSPVLSLALESIEPGTTRAHFKTEGAMGPVTYDFGDGLTHTPEGTDTAHTYAAPGSYAVSVADAVGGEASIEIEVPEPTPPAAPESVAPPEPEEPATLPAPGPVEPPEGEPTGGSDESPSFDPGEHTVAEAVAYAEGKDEAEIVRLIELEEAGRNRTTLLAHLEGMLS